jgi:hypothetical protein
LTGVLGGRIILFAGWVCDRKMDDKIIGAGRGACNESMQNNEWEEPRERRGGKL